MRKLGIIGTGNMGKAILGGIIRGGKVSKDEILIYDLDPQAREKAVEEFGVNASKNCRELVQSSERVLLAVKPQNLEALGGEVKGSFREGQLVVSILAGKKIEEIMSALSEKIYIIRAMPNTPCLVGKGVTGLYASPGVVDEEIAFVKDIFSHSGVCAFFDKEELIDVVTGFTGSGPAFIFVLIEALSDGAVRCGLPRKEAQAFATALVEGSAALVRESGIHPEKLKEMVMSPGGTTAEGISVLEKAGIRGIIMEAVSASYKKTKSIT